MLQKKCVWQVTTIIQPALRHLGTSHFWKVLYNKIPMGQIRWPIFLFFMYMLVLTEKTSIFPKSNMFWILVFSCPKMTLITIFTRMTQELIGKYGLLQGGGSVLQCFWKYLYFKDHHFLKVPHPTPQVLNPTRQNKNRLCIWAQEERKKAQNSVTPTISRLLQGIQYLLMKNP